MLENESVIPIGERITVTFDPELGINDHLIRQAKLGVTRNYLPEDSVESVRIVPGHEEGEFQMIVRVKRFGESEFVEEFVPL